MKEAAPAGTTGGSCFAPSLFAEESTLSYANQGTSRDALASWRA